MRKLILIVIALFVIFCASYISNAQAITRITNRCPSPNLSTYGTATIQTDGNINLVPCPSKDVLINGSPIPSLSGIISGTGTANTFPIFTGAQTIGDSPFSYNGSTYTFNNSTLDSTFLISFRPNNTTGVFTVGDITTPTNYWNLSQLTSTSTLNSTVVNFGDTLSTGNNTRFSLSDTTQIATLRAGAENYFSVNGNLNQINVSGQTLAFGDLALSNNGTIFTIDDTGNSFSFGNTNDAAVFNLSDVLTYSFFRTVTTGGTTGNQTIDKPVGTVNLAAAATSITVTNSTVNTSSIIFVTTRTNDATCYAVNAVAGSGSFVINMSAACTSETSVGFLVTN